MISKKLKCISGLASGSPYFSPFKCVIRVNAVALLQASPSSSGVMANGLNAEEGLEVKKPSFASSPGSGCVRTSLQSIPNEHSCRLLPPSRLEGCHQERQRFRIQIAAPAQVNQRDVVSGTQEGVAAALVDQWVGAQGCRRFGATGFPNQDNVVDIGATVDPEYALGKGLPSFTSTASIVSLPLIQGAIGGEQSRCLSSQLSKTDWSVGLSLRDHRLSVVF